MIGQRLLHYEITEKLGEGGMGVVYKARDTHLDRFVAIKVLPRERVADPVRKARFVQEAKAASALNHPNIVVVHDISADAGHDFIALEYVAGKTLDQLIPRKGMRLNDALKIAVQIADALARAHAVGIIHRDLKPANIMVDEHGQVKVLDFGLAKLTEQRVSEDDATVTMGVKTDEDTIVGTVAYMSPEQAEGKEVDARSDIFSFGALLYEMVTGRRAFQGDSKISTLVAVLHKEPLLGADVPRDLQRVIACCLKKDPERRFYYMVDVKVTLLELKDGLDSSAPDTPAPTSPRRRRLVVLAGAALVMVALAGAGLYRHFAVRDSTAETPYHAVSFTSYPGLESDPSLSPDGNQVAFAWRGENQDNQDIYVRVVGAGMGRPLRMTTDPAPDYDPVFSPDGRMIAFLRDSSEDEAAVYVTALGGTERRVAEIPGLPRVRAFEIVGRYLTWAPDGKHLLATFPLAAPKMGASGLSLIALETGAIRPLTRPPSDAFDRSPAFSPDGKTLAFVRGRIAWADVYVVPVTDDLRAAKEPRQITLQHGRLNGVTWTPDGREIVFSGGSLVDQALWRVGASGGAGPRRVNWAGERGFHPSISRTGGRLVYQTYNVNKSIWRLDLAEPGVAAGSPVRLISSSQFDESPAVSPDGRRIAFCSAASGAYEVWVAEANGQNPRMLTALGRGAVSGAEWSPDGRRIAFFSGAEGQPEIYTIGAEGGALRRLTTHPGADVYPSYSRDGRWIYFTSDRSGQYEIWKVLAEGGEPVQVTRTGGFRPYESVDGKVLYYIQTVSQWRVAGRLMRMSTGGGGAAPMLTEKPGIHTFQVAAEGIYFLVWPTLADRLRWQFYRFSDGSIRTVMETVAHSSPFFCLSPDGRKILYTDPGTVPGDIMLVENFR